MFPVKAIPTLPNGIHRYERGLYVRVTDTSRAWVYKYQLNGKRRELGLGSATTQPLTAVLAKCQQMKALVAQGIDPKDQITKVKEEKKAEQVKARMPTLNAYADHALEKIIYLRGFTNSKTEAAWRRDVEVLMKEFGTMRLDEIRRDDVAAFLRQWWTTQPRRGEDLRMRLFGLLNIAKGEELIKRNPAEWKGCLDAALPPMGLVRRSIPVEHHAALSAEDLREVVGKLWRAEDTASLAVVFGALTAGRANEYLGGKWSEIDLEEATFSVPIERRKDKKPTPHVVPLPRQLMKLLHKLDTSSDYVFASDSGDGPLSRQTAVRRITSATDKPVTLHGMRSTFSDWCAKNDKNFLVSEKQLMHAVGNTVFRAYQRDDLLEQRRVLMQEWADFLLPDE